jgi:hypothetical protein
VEPVVRDLDRFFGDSRILGRVPLLVGVFDEQTYVAGLKSVENIEEIVSVRHSILWHLGRKTLGEVFIRTHHRPQPDDRQLVKQWHVHPTDLIQSKQALLLGEHFLEKVLVEHPVWRQVKLH